MRANLMKAVLLSALVATPAFAGRGGSNEAIQAAIKSGSVDTIVAEVERAEKLACVSCISTVLPLVDHPSARVRNVAGWWLAKRGVRNEVRDMALVRLQGNDPVLARNAADVLAALRHPDAIPGLSAYLANPLDGDSGAAAANALGEIGSQAALPGLQTGMASQLAPVRAASVRALRNLRGYLDGSAAVALLADPDESVRTEAVYTLGAMQYRQGVDGLMNLLSKDASPTVRKQAAWALGQIGDQRAVPVLTQAKSDPDRLVSSIASASLARMR